MKNRIIVKNLQALLRQIEAMFPTLHNDYKAQKTSLIITKAIKLLEHYNSFGNSLLEETRANSIMQMQKALHYLNEYYKESLEVNAHTNYLVQEESFLIPASQGIFSFVEVHKHGTAKKETI